mgnify:CR=1 FL=1
MRLVIAVDERPAEALLERVPEIINVRAAEILLVHVLDPGGPEEWERIAGRHLLRPGPLGRGRERMRAVDRTEGERVLSRAAAAAEAWGATGLETRLLEGSPKHEIVELLGTEGANLLVVFVHGREIGPKSIHKGARFMIDHAPCPALIIKG